MAKVQNPISAAEAQRRAREAADKAIDPSWPEPMQKVFRTAYMTGYLRCWNDYGLIMGETLDAFASIEAPR